MKIIFSYLLFQVLIYELCYFLIKTNKLTFVFSIALTNKTQIMKKLSLVIGFIAFVLIPLKSQEESRLFRFPSIHGDKIVFMKSGDLYQVNVSGGVARKLTNHIGFEMFPKISPNGEKVAFTAQYDGNTEVYVMPIDGGEPERLTYTATLNRDALTDRMGPNNIVMAWTPDGESIIYRSRRYSYNSFRGQLFQVSKNGGLSEEVPLLDGGFCSFSPDGKKLAFNRVFREFRTWKYYKGGMADDIWIYDYKSKKTEKITDNVSQDIFPMWAGNEIFFLSDRDRIMNLFSYNLDTKETTKHTAFDKYDIKFPSINGNKIVFENEGFIYVFNTETKQQQKVSIIIKDDQVAARNEIKDASKNITSFNVAPDGNRIVLSARGDVYSLPAKEGVTYNLTRSSGANDRNATWSPDGKNIAYISDASGEFEIYIQPSDFSKPPVQLTKGADTYYYEMKWSPDGKKILWSDRLFRLRYIDISTKAITEVAKSNIWELRDFNWSPDNKWITFSDYIPNSDMQLVKVYNLDTKQTIEITQGWYDANSPAFSDDGKYLMFASSRSFDPIYSATEWNIAYANMEKIYMVLLAADTPSPLEVKNDEVKVGANDDKKKDESNSSVVVKVDAAGIQDRIIELPVKAANYGDFVCIDNKIFYRKNDRTRNERSIQVYDLKEKKETKLLDKASLQFTADRKKMMIVKGDRYYIVDKTESAIKLKKQVNLADMKVKVNMEEEWSQIFNEAWRQMRDFFYVENMHGVDWEAIKAKYEVYLPYVKHRADLTYIIGEMIGELNIGHAYSGGGDYKKPERIKLGLLGAKFEKHSSGYFQIKELIESANWNTQIKNPLKEPGVKALENYYIISINGQETKQLENIFEALVGQAGKHVELEINSSPKKEGSWKEVIIPVADESNLYYYKWIQNNIKKVNEATDGQVGYIHIRDMGNTGLKDFMSYFYPQLNKKALIIDDRGNGGGNVSPMLIERLRREVTRSRITRNSEVPGQIPNQMMVGPKVLLMNHYSASDGDLFPYSFKKHKLGTTIGTRTWGGVVGIRGPIPFVDGGILYKPEFASYSGEASEWIIEGFGVEPDIVVDNDPSEEYWGKDAQLDKAIEVILEELKDYKGIPNVPVAPDKSK